MKTHRLKLRIEYWESVIKEEKKSEVRRNDRDFQKGDLIIFEQVTREDDCHIGGAYVSEAYIITHVLPGNGDGLDYEYCVLSISPYTNPEKT